MDFPIHAGLAKQGSPPDKVRDARVPSTASFRKRSDLAWETHIKIKMAGCTDPNGTSWYTATFQLAAELAHHVEKECGSTRIVAGKWDPIFKRLSAKYGVSLGMEDFAVGLLKTHWIFGDQVTAFVRPVPQDGMYRIADPEVRGRM